MRPTEDRFSAVLSTWLVVLHKGSTEGVVLWLQEGASLQLHVQRWIHRQRGISLSGVAVSVSVMSDMTRRSTAYREFCLHRFRQFILCNQLAELPNYAFVKGIHPFVIWSIQFVAVCLRYNQKLFHANNVVNGKHVNGVHYYLDLTSHRARITAHFYTLATFPRNFIFKMLRPEVLHCLWMKSNYKQFVSFHTYCLLSLDVHACILCYFWKYIH